jgi:MarR family transcriptional regulator, organic hydroperoxide resistance regulator
MSKEIELIEVFHRFYRKLWKLISPAFKGDQKSLTEIMVLVKLKKKSPRAVTELAQIIGIPTSTLTGIIDRLVASGFIERTRDPKDRRKVLVSATEKVKEFQGDRKAAAGKALREIFAGLPRQRIERLIEDIKYLLSVLGDDPSDT